ncbi:MAG: hypothetical protein ACSLE8_00125, partial [Rhodococcus sp. (in: high G+C Gram-positive bacteria)]
MSEDIHPTVGLDDVIHQRTRIEIVALLDTTPPGCSEHHAGDQPQMLRAHRHIDADSRIIDQRLHRDHSLPGD